MEIKNYLDDGANWQAQCVLAYIRAYSSNIVNKTWDDEHKRYVATVEVGRFENGREQGYVFSVRYLTHQMNYAIYEHRNSDNICIVKFENFTINTPDLDMVIEAMGDNKNNYTKAFTCGQIEECGEWIIKDGQEFIRDILEKKNISDSVPE